MAKILVTGATGYVGGRLAPRLIAAGHQVRCLARHAGNLAGRDWGGFEVVEGSVSDGQAMDRALTGCDAAYYLVHSMDSGDEGFAERDRKAAQTFSDAARRSGTVKQIIYLGGLGADSPELSPHLRSRQEVGRVLKSGGVPVTEFRAAIVVGSGSASFEMLRWLTERLPVMITPRWVNTRCQPIAIRDVLSYLQEALLKEDALDRIFEIGGTDVLTYREMMLIYAKQRDLRRWLIPVPVLTPRLSSLWVDLVTPIPASLARPLVEGLKNEVVVRDSAARDMFTVKPLSYGESVRLALERNRENFHETTWHDSYQVRHNGESPANLEVREGMMVEQKSIYIPAPPRQVYDAIATLGGTTGWLYADALWDVRGLMDRVAGGPGMRRGRRSPTDLRPGDALDFWRVMEAEPGKLLRLYAEMKLPGEGWLQYEMAEPDDHAATDENSAGGGTKLTQTVFFEPRGLAGHLYWLAMAVPHRFIFTGMLRKIKQKVMAVKG